MRLSAVGQSLKPLRVLSGAENLKNASLAKRYLKLGATPLMVAKNSNKTSVACGKLKLVPQPRRKASVTANLLMILPSLRSP